MNKVYISIPITGLDYDTQVAKANKAKKELESKGYKVITPFEICPEKGKSDAFYMGKCIESLLQHDEIYVLKGWEHSKGCKVEICTAEIYGLTVSYEP